MENRDNYEYMDENSIHEDLLCPLCSDPLDEPLCANQCGHTFCRKCITNTFQTMSKCPTCRQKLTLEDFHPVNIRPFLNQLNQLLVKCKGCLETNIQRGNFKDHTAKCLKINVSCPAAEIKCDWTGQRDQLQDHISICPLIKVQPMITELNALVKQQSEQIRFLYTILEKTSNNHKTACQEKEYKARTPYCDVCNKKITFNEHERRLHYCPQTDICSDCVKKYFP
jgi:E3 ubiquitin-protein ligase NRDP1